MQVIPEVLDTRTARVAIDRARATESRSVFNHSVRSYMFAELLAAHQGLVGDRDFNREAVFYGCLLHDLGVGSAAPGEVRFEVEGADLAAILLTENGYGADFVDEVWESIALHSSAEIAERRGPTCYLVRTGVGMDFGRDVEFVDDETAASIHRAYPRLSMERSLSDAVVEHAARSAAAAPRYSMPGDLLRQRERDGITVMEVEAVHSRWAFG